LASGVIAVDAAAHIRELPKERFAPDMTTSRSVDNGFALELNVAHRFSEKELVGDD
jgi:hypothetical protein